MVGYDVHEDNRTFEVEGLTGTVRRYTTESMQFPCYIVVASAEYPVERYKIDALKQMFVLSSSLDEEGASTISIYYSQDGKTVRIGQIYAKQAKAFLNLFSTSKVEGFYDKDTFLEGDYLFVLA